VTAQDGQQGRVVGRGGVTHQQGDLIGPSRQYRVEGVIGSGSNAVTYKVCLAAGVTLSHACSLSAIACSEITKWKIKNAASQCQFLTNLAHNAEFMSRKSNLCNVSLLTEIIKHVE
jgi:protein involved in ribonucleotide reduction